MMYFPFSAIIGQEHVKKALILAAIHPAVQGVLLAGEKGTAKSTIVRSFARLMAPDYLIECPVSVTEDRLAGSIHFEKAIRQGEKTVEPGLLQQADGKWLYIDEVNLLSEQHMQVIAEAISSNVLKIEREGLSCRIPTRFTMIGTMNPEEGKLPPQFLDRFALYVEVKGEREVEDRVKIMKQRLAYEHNPEKFCRNYELEDRLLRERILDARQRLPEIEADESMLKLAAAISLEANCAGHRADLLLIETGKAKAAFEGRNHVTEEDIQTASLYVLPHRLRDPNRTEESKQTASQNQPQQEQQKQPPQAQFQEDQFQQDQLKQEQPQQDRSTEAQDPDSKSQSSGFADEQLYGIEEGIKLSAFRLHRVDRKQRAGVGKRTLSRTKLKRGRFIKAVLPKGKVRDLAFMDTLRAAAPFQRSRAGHAAAITIFKDDLREKVREKRIGTSIVFAVDASGSMTANKRMGAVKGAVYALLESAYADRDHVSLVAFRKQEAELVLPMTRSLILAKKKLAEIPAGGKTPLALGLVKSVQYISALKRKQKELLPFLVIVTDGRANVPYHGENALEDALAAGKQIAALGIKTLVIDTEESNRFVSFGLAMKIAEEMNAAYYKLSELTSSEIIQAVKISI